MSKADEFKKQFEYNRKSQIEFGWQLEWFGIETDLFSAGEAFDGDDPSPKWNELIRNIKATQKRFGLKEDGLVGPMTYSRIYTERIAEEEDHFETPESFEIVHNLDLYESNTKSYRTSARIKTKKINSIREIVVHWDATLSAKHCINILNKRNISTHFIIDNDGTIIQLIPVKDIAYHAGSHNSHTIGIDLSNAYYTKYNDWYVKNGFGARPVIKSEVHGKESTHLGYYPEQLESLEKLVNYLCDKYNIEKSVPLNKDGKLITTVYDPAVKKRFKGVICHYHLTKNKIDCQGLELDKLFPKREEV